MTRSVPLKAWCAGLVLACAGASALAQVAPPFDPASVMADPIGSTANLITSNAPNLPPSQRVVVTTFRVVFATRASGTVNAAHLGGPGSGGLSGNFTLKLDDATMQAITDTAYRQFLKALQARGAELVTPDQIADPYVRDRIGARSVASPVRFSAGTARGQYSAFAPGGVPFYVGTQDSGLLEIGGIGQRFAGLGNSAAEDAEAKLAGDYQAVVVRPTIWIDFIETSSRFGGFTGAPGPAEPGLRVTAGATQMVVTHSTQVRRDSNAGGSFWSRANFLGGNLMVLGLKQTLVARDAGVARVGPEGGASAATSQGRGGLGVLGSILGGQAGQALLGGGYEVQLDADRYRASADALLAAVVEMWASKVTMR